MHQGLSHLVLHFSLIRGVGPATILQILKCCFGFDTEQHSQQNLTQKTYSTDDIYRFYARDFVKICGLTSRMATLCAKGLEDRDIIDRELTRSQKSGARFVSITDEQYPFLLSQIHLPPIGLWVQGSFEALEKKTIAVVGTRKCSGYAAQALSLLLPEVISAGWTIVSGGALGVDTIAHTQTLDQGGRTVAVLGSGLLNRYPQSNNRLFDKIIANGGALVSPFPLGMPPERNNFPMRNRLIAGLSVGTIVLQAPRKSGALITASYAMDEGRQVWAVPGLITSQLSQGSHHLLSHGALVATCADDILTPLGDLAGTARFKEAINTEESILDEPGDQSLVAKILEEITMIRSVDEIAELIGVSPTEVAEELFQLQLAGKVTQTYAGTWELA